MASATVLQPQTEQYIADILQNTFNDLPSYINRLAETNNLSESEAFKLFQDTIISSLSNVTETPLLSYLKKNEEIINLESEIRFIKQIYASEYNDYTKKYREWNEQYLKCNDNLAILRNELTAARESLKFAKDQSEKLSKQQMGNLQSKIEELTRNVNRIDMEKIKLKMDLDRARAELDRTNKQLYDFDVKNLNSLQELFNLLPQTQFELPLNVQEMTDRLRKHIENSIRLQNTIDSLQNDLRQVSDANRQCENQSGKLRKVSTELSELQTQYEYMKNVNVDLERQIADCRLNNRRLQDENQKLIDANNKLVKQHDSLDVENQNLNSKVQALQIELEQYATNYSTHTLTQDELQNLSKEIIALNTQKTNLLSQLDESQKNLEDFKRLFENNDRLLAQCDDTCRKELESARSEAAVVQDILQTKQNDLEKQLSDTTTKLNSMQSESANLRAQVAKQQEYIERLKKQRDTDMQYIEQMTTISVDDSNDETITKLTNDVRKKDEYITALQQKLTSEFNQRTEEMNNLDEIQTKLTQVNEDLRAKNKALTEQLSATNNSYKELLQTNDKLNAQCQELSKNVDVSQTIEALDNDKKQLIDNHNQTIDSINKAHKETIDELEVKIEKLNTEQRNFEKELEKKDALYKSLLEKYYRAKNLYDTTSDVDKIFSVLFRDEPNTIIQTILPFKMFNDSLDSDFSTTSKLPPTPRPIDYDSSQTLNSFPSSSRSSIKRKLPDSTVDDRDDDSKIMRTNESDFDIGDDVDDSKNLNPIIEEITMSSCKTVSDVDRSERFCNIMQGTRQSSTSSSRDVADDTSLDSETNTQTFDSYSTRHRSISISSLDNETQENTTSQNIGVTTTTTANMGTESRPISISSDSNVNN